MTLLNQLSKEQQSHDEANARKEVVSHLLSDKAKLIVCLDDEKFSFKDGQLFSDK